MQNYICDLTSESKYKVKMDKEIDRLINATINLQFEIQKIYNKQRELINSNSETLRELTKETKLFDEFFEKSLIESNQKIDEESTLFEQYFKTKNDQINELCESLNTVLSLSDLNSKMKAVQYYLSLNQVKNAFDSLRDVEKYVKDNIHDLHYYNLLTSLQKFIKIEHAEIKSRNVNYLKNVIQIEHHRPLHVSRAIYEVKLCYNDHQTFQEHFNIFYEIHNDDFITKFYNLISLFIDVIFEKIMQYDYQITSTGDGFLIVVEMFQPFVYFEGLMNGIRCVFRFFYEQFGESFSQLFPVMDFEQQFTRYFRMHMIPRDKDDFLKKRAKMSVHLLNLATFLRNEIHLDLDTEDSLMKNFHKKLDQCYLDQRVDGAYCQMTTYVCKDWTTNLKVLNANDDNKPTYTISVNVDEFLRNFTLLIQDLLDFESELLMKNIEYVLEMVTNVLVNSNLQIIESNQKQMALFYNNLIYIYEELNKFFFETNEEYFQPHREKLLVLVNEFKEKAKEHLNEFIDNQNTQIDSLLNESGLLELNIGYNTEDIIRQCIRQIELIKHSWYKILPDDLYFEKFVLMINYFFRQLIRIVLNFEDIPAKATGQFLYIYQIVLTRAIKFFNTKEELEQRVEYWAKFNTLVFILGSSLEDIGDHLDVENSILQFFTNDELRSIIRALFQNTSRRAEVLAKIK